ncbi:MAG: type II toxin-antitoxin system ParD family antitoxin [Bryobacterales bacterium]|nr:type II toxin-antitoxin system ParD family antitoxin [Bryobacterales bacterium]
MPATMNISLPDVMKAFVAEQVDSGAYASVSEYVRELVRRDQTERAQAKLETLLLEGIESGEPIPLNSKYREDLLRDLEARRKKKKS